MLSKNDLSKIYFENQKKNVLLIKSAVESPLKWKSEDCSLLLLLKANAFIISK